MLELVKNRRSIRKYKDNQVEKEKVDEIVKVASLAPSSMNKKPTEIIIIEDKEIIRSLQNCKKAGTLALKTAPLAIVVLGDAEKSDVWIEDASIVSTFITLEAERLGLGSNWIQLRNRVSKDVESEVMVRMLLNIPSKYGVLSIITLGYKDEYKEPYSEDEVDYSKVHRNKFDSKNKENV